jgi:hypothetical protein
MGLRLVVPKQDRASVLPVVASDIRRPAGYPLPPPSRLWYGSWLRRDSSLYSSSIFCILG